MDVEKTKVIHPKLEIGVIDVDLLKQSLSDTAPKGEEGRLVREEGIPWDEVEEMRLEFRHILNIDHLWMLTGLSKLSLSNNIIEKIENIESLVNLRELDLSFNKIKKIENLDLLINLEVLSLYGNEITTIENISNLEQLLIFSIGENQIADIKNILYLRQFDKLRSLNLAGNPCCSLVPDFREWIAGFLPKIIYYEYKMIQREERKAATEKYSKEIEFVQDSEREIYFEKMRLKEEAAEEERHAGSFVEFLGSSALFDKMFDGDLDGNLLLTALKPRITDSFDTYKTKFCAITRRIFDIGQEMFLDRQQELDQFLKCVEGEKVRIQTQSQDLIESFVDKKLAYIDKVYEEFETVQETELDPKSASFDQLMTEFNRKAQVILESFNTLNAHTWMNLMKFELTIHGQLEEVNENFSIVITDMLNSFLEKSSAYFTELRNMEREWSEELLELSLTVMNDYAMGGKVELKVTREVEKLFADKENVIQSCAGSHDFHNLQIDNREDKLVNRANSWLSNLVSHLSKDEIMRNRAQVLEINKFLDIQRQDFFTIYEEMIDSPSDTPSLLSDTNAEDEKHSLDDD